MIRRSAFLVFALLPLLAGCDYLKSPEKRVAEAETLIAQGEPRRALIELRNALQKDPDLPQARLLLAEVALWLGDAAAAGRELRAVPEDHAPQRRADLATRLDLAAGRYAEVIANIGEPGPGQPANLWLYRGLAKLALGNAAAAEADFRVAYERDPRLAAAGVGVVDARAAQGDIDGALEQSGTLTRDHAESAAAWFVRGALLARSGSLREAQEALERASQLAPKQLEVVRQIALLVMLTEVQIANRDLDKAKATAEVLGRVAPGSPIAAVNAARVTMGSNDFAGAAVELRRIVNRSPQFTRARFLLGVALAAQGNLAQAGQELTAVLEQSPQNVEARQLLAQVRLRLEDPDSALRVLVPALESAGNDQQVTQLFEAARQQLGDSPRSLTLIEREYSKAPGNRGLKMQLAAAYLRANQGDKALALLRKDEDPARVDPVADRQLLAAIAQVEGEAAAQRKLEQMLAARPNDTDLVLMAAQVYMTARDVPRARRLLQDALARNAGHPGLGLALARVQLISGEREAAVQSLTQLRTRDPAAVTPRLLLAQLALQRDDAKEADTLIAEAVKGTTRPAETQNAAGLMYLGTGRYDSAVQHFLAGTESDPADATLWLNLGRAQLALERNDAARQALERALKLHENWLPAEGALAFLELQSGNSAAAIKRVDALKVARPHDVDVLVLEAEVRAALRQFTEADRALVLAARKQPSAELAAKHYQLRQLGELPKPSEPLEQWLQEHPNDVRIRGSLAEARMRAGDRAGAAKQYETMVARDPRDVVSLNNLAWLYLELGDRRAVETARKAAALAPNAPAVADTLGWVLVQTGSVNEGLGHLQRAVDGDPRNEDMQYHLAAGLAKAGKVADARTRLETLLREKSSFPARKEAEKLLEQLNKASS